MALRFRIETEGPAQCVSAVNPLGRGEDDTTAWLRHGVCVAVFSGGYS